jgi:outer membrane receptor protein involved in Fe transport
MRTMRVVWTSLCVLFFSFQANAGTTGKISGRVLDKETGQPLPGANIVIKETLMGAATDNNGNFFILNVSVGNYTVAASMIGYEVKEFTKVRIKQDLTTILDYELKSTLVPIEEVVKVIAKRPFVEMDVTTSVTYIDAGEMESQPISQFQDAISLITGAVSEVTNTGGRDASEIHIRGGRGREVVYMVDGMVLQDPVSGAFDSNVPESSIEEIAVYSGGFGAEYGSAQSGVVNLVTRDGGPKTSGRVSYKTNDYSGITDDRDILRNFDKNDQVEVPGENPFVNPEHHERYKRLDVNLGGPEPISTYLLPELGVNIPGESIRYFFSSEVTNTMGRFPTSRSVTRKEFFPWEDPSDPEILKKMQGRPEVDKTFSGKLSYRPNATQRIVVGGLRSWEDYGEFDNTWKYHLRGRRQYNENTRQGYMNWSHTLSPRTFYEVKLDQYKTALVWDLDGDFYIDANGDTLEATGTDIPWRDVVPGDDMDENVPFPDNSVSGWRTGGNYRVNYHEDSRKTTTLRADLTSQATPTHLMKTGMELRYYDLYTFLADVASGDNLYRDDFHVFPVQVGLYAQDKMELKGMIVNAGLRADYLNPGSNAMVPEDPSDPVIDNIDGGAIKNPVPAETKFQVSPRLGISHPLSPNDVFHFSYGHYFQIPQLSYMYTNMNYILTGAFGIMGNPSLQPEKTVSYEVGVEHAFTDNFKLDATGFYKDITGLTDVEQIQLVFGNWFGRYRNTDYGTVRGFELAFKKRAGGALRYWSSSLNYTYSIAKGKSSSNRQNYDFIWDNFDIPTTENPLDWDQRHTAVLNIGFDVPPGEKLLGVSFLNNLGINVLTNFGSGMPWTPPPSTQEARIERTNQLRMPYTTTTDLKVRKGFRVSTTSLSVFAEVLNLFDKSNNLLRMVDKSDDNGVERYYIEYWLPHQQFEEGLIDQDPDYVKAAGGKHQDPSVAGPRRRIRTGIVFEF